MCTPHHLGLCFKRYFCSWARTIFMKIILNRVLSGCFFQLWWEEKSMDHICDLTVDNIYLNMDRSKKKICHHMRLPPLSVKDFIYIWYSLVVLYSVLREGIQERGWKCCYFCFFDFLTFVLCFSAVVGTMEKHSLNVLFVKKGDTHVCI